MAVKTLTVSTGSSREIVDITEQVSRAITELGAKTGIVCISVPHCTCSVYVNENETGLVQDTLDMLREMTQDRQWRHNRIDNNADAHLAASLVGNSVMLPVRDGQLELGTWQRVMLVELDGPRSRRITVTTISENTQG
ncbi:MAG: secondary thiamine-phosphate synthase enzyme YjbQ [Armatimonadota bacterium]